VADTVPAFPLSSAQRLVSTDRAARAGGAALRAEESLPQKLSKLEGFLVQYGLPPAETMPFFAALLSLPLPADYAPLLVSPEQQKQQTLHVLLTILLRIAAQQPVLFVMEDLHWADPSIVALPNYGSFDLFTRDIITTDEIKHYVSKAPMR
jgi:predicted ATPase